MDRERVGFWFFVTSFVLGCAAMPAFAQSKSLRRYEVGGFIGAVNFREAIHEKPLAVGMRFGYRVTKRLALESEVNSCVADSSGNFGQLLLVAGPRVGIALGPLTVAGKLRAGAIHFGGRAFRAWNPGVRFKPVVNLGAVFELAASPRVSIRIDAGDNVIPFGSTVIRGPLPPRAAQYGTTHNREGSFGVVFRF